MSGLQLERRDVRGNILVVGDAVRITHDFSQAVDVMNQKRETGGKWVKLTTKMVGRIEGEMDMPDYFIVPFLFLVKFPKWKRTYAISALNLVKLDVIDALARARSDR